MDYLDDATGALSSNHNLTFGTLTKLLRRRAWLIITCAVLGATSATVISLQSTPLYTAAGKITIAGESFAIPELQGALRNNSQSDPMLLLHTELQALSSLGLLRKVADQLHAGERSEFNPALRPPGTFNRLLLSLPQLHLAPARSVSPAAVEDSIVAALARNLIVFNDNHSLVIDLAFTSADAQFSTDVINTLIKDYIAGQAAERSSADVDANAALFQRIDQLNTEITGLDRQVSEIRDKNQIVGLRAGSVGQQQLEDLATEATRATLERARLEDAWQRAITLARSGQSDQLAAVLSSETIVRLREQESLAEGKLAELLARHGPAYPPVHDAQASLEAARHLLSLEVQRITASLTTQLQVARQHESFAQDQLNQARGDAVKNTAIQAKIEDLKMQIADRRSLAQKLLERTQQTTARPAAQQTPDVRILSLASPPTVPSSPKPKLAGAFGLLAGIVLGCLLAIATGRGGRAGRNDASETGGLLSLGLLATRHRKRGSVMERVLIDPNGPEADVLRTARLRIRLVSRPTRPRVVALVPVQDVEAVWSVPAAFARVAALDGERVLLIEGNLQDPKLALALSTRPGELLAVLAGEVGWRAALDRDPDTSLDLLVTSKASRSGYGLLSGTRLQNLLVEAQEDYTMIVLSAPSLEESADALLLANRADASLVIFGSKNIVRQQQHQLVQDLVRSSNGPVFALVSN